eukprot:Rmarinus@m.7870
MGCGSSSLYLHVMNASNLDDMDVGGSSDAYVVAKLINRDSGAEQNLITCCCIPLPYRYLRTTPVKNSKNPTWNEVLPFSVPGALHSYDLLLEVWDWDRVTRDDFMGCVRVGLDQRHIGAELSMPLEAKDGKPKKVKGQLRFQISTKRPITDKTPLNQA